MNRLDNSYYDYERMRKIPPLTDFKDIKVGETYHIPPTIIYGRRDFKVMEKSPTTITGIMTNLEDGTTQKSTLYESELSMRFIVKKQEVNKD